MRVSVVSRWAAAAACVLSVCVLSACQTAAPKPASGAAPKDEAGFSYAGSRDPAFFRKPGPRSAETIFSPLDLPTPSDLRTASGTPGPGYWQQKVDYAIEASLEAGNIVRGVETVTYINNSPEPLPLLWIHLEQNLFRSDSLGALSVEPDTRFGHRGFEGGIDIHSCKAAGEDGKDLPLHVYDTVARLDLPEPVAPKGGHVSFRIAWSFKIPPFGADRMGTNDLKDGTVFQVAQWFPAVAVYDDVHGWNTLPYLGQGEFYTNYGDFDVKLTVPRSHIVAATGELQNEGEVLTKEQQDRLAKARESEDAVMIVDEADIGKPESRPGGDGPLTWRFKAEGVRTFAWASSPAFLWDACFLKSTGPEVPHHPDQTRGTLVMSVYPREALPLWKQSSKMLRFSIDHYSSMWHRYPYPAATNVNGIVGGMEYPMIIFCSERHDEHGLYGVTTHEIGHNWFPMLVNTDERRHAWMDEGFNSFINIYSERAYFEREHPENEDAVRAAEMAGQMAQGQQQPMEIIPDAIWRGRLGHLEYGKTAAAMYLLREEVLGPERFDAAFRRYVDLWAFKSPQPADFFRCMEDAAGMDLSWFWRGWVLETGTLDQAVTDVRFDADKGWVRITFTNLGELVMPAMYRVTYAGGSTETRKLPVEAWSTTNQWTAAWDTEGRQVIKVELDPAGRLPDRNRANNTWEAKPAAPTKGGGARKALINQ